MTTFSQNTKPVCPALSIFVVKEMKSATHNPERRHQETATAKPFGFTNKAQLPLITPIIEDRVPAYQDANAQKAAHESMLKTEYMKAISIELTRRFLLPM